jgi:hypothetical protein
LADCIINMFAYRLFGKDKICAKRKIPVWAGVCV